MTQQVDHAREQAKAQLQSITEMVGALRAAIEDDMSLEEAVEAIQADALDVQVRTGWYNPGLDKGTVDEYTILLCTGGPAVRIIGILSQYAEPDSARIEYQDWGTPWTDFPLTSEEEAIVLEYAQQFYYGE